MGLNYDRDVRTDLNNLHYEWVRYPELVLAYGRELAEAKRLVAEAEENVGVKKAQALKKAAKLGLKVDETKAESEVDKEYLDALAELRQAKYNRDITQVAYDAISGKKYTLENSVRLHGQEYFATPVEHSRYEDWADKRFADVAKDKVKTEAADRAREAYARREEARNVPETPAGATGPEPVVKRERTRTRSA